MVHANYCELVGGSQWNHLSTPGRPHRRLSPALTSRVFAYLVAASRGGTRAAEVGQGDIATALKMSQSSASISVRWLEIDGLIFAERSRRGALSYRIAPLAVAK